MCHVEMTKRWLCSSVCAEQIASSDDSMRRVPFKWSGTTRVPAVMWDHRSISLVSCTMNSPIMQQETRNQGLAAFLKQLLRKLLYPKVKKSSGSVFCALVSLLYHHVKQRYADFISIYAWISLSMLFHGIWASFCQSIHYMNIYYIHI